MKEFLLVRHAKSSWKDSSLSDVDRPLNKRGKKDGPRMASYVRKQGIILDYLASSPAKRAYNTAIYFRDEFSKELQGLDIYRDLYFGSEEDILFVIQEMSKDVNFPAVFSHNPTLTYTTNRFQGEEFDNIPTCGVVHLRSQAEVWKDVEFHNTELIASYFPKLVLS